MSHNADYVVFFLLSLQPFLEYGVIRKKECKKQSWKNYYPFPAYVFALFSHWLILPFTVM